MNAEVYVCLVVPPFSVVDTTRAPPPCQWGRSQSVKVKSKTHYGDLWLEVGTERKWNWKYLEERVGAPDDDDDEGASEWNWEKTH